MSEHGTPNTGDERDREVEAVARAMDLATRKTQSWEERAKEVLDALDAVRARAPQGEDHEAGKFTGLRNGTGKFVECEVYHDIYGEMVLYIAGAGTFHVSDLPRAVAAVERKSMSPARDGTVAVEDVVAALAVAELYVRENRVRGRDAVQDHALVRTALAAFDASGRT